MPSPSKNNEPAFNPWLSKSESLELNPMILRRAATSYAKRWPSASVSDETIIHKALMFIAVALEKELRQIKKLEKLVATHIAEQ